MRAITDITVQTGTDKKATVFLTYNFDREDYSFTPYDSTEEAVVAIKKMRMEHDPYFPIHAEDYRWIVMKGNQAIFDERVEF